MIRAYLDARHLEDEVDLEFAGALCQGRCNDGPVLIVDGDWRQALSLPLDLEIRRNIIKRLQTVLRTRYRKEVSLQCF